MHNIYIKSLTVKHLLSLCNGKSTMVESRLKKTVHAIWMDSRKIETGDIFLALTSENDDGHKYVSSALKSGAIAAIVKRKYLSRYTKREQQKLILVADPLKAIQKAATKFRIELDVPCIAITGSSGKTTTRQFISAVLSEGYRVGNTDGNWNNHIGVPLSLLKFTSDVEMAILELGANHIHEIDTLTKIVKPDVAVITNIGYAHIGMFGSLDNTSKAKLEIAQGLPKSNGLLLINGDDKRLVGTCAKMGQKALRFGTSSRCAILAEDIQVDRMGRTLFIVKGFRYKLSMPGRHFMYSALPAIFLAIQSGIEEKVIAKALFEIKPDSLRGKIIKRSGVRFIVDCYNANPSSMKSSISLLNDVAETGKTCAIVGDMLELGSYAKQLHRQLGKYLAQNDIAKLIVVGDFAEYVAESAIKSGLKKTQVFTVKTAVDAIPYARRILKKGDTVLLKGSRGIQLENILKNF